MHVAEVGHLGDPAELLGRGLGHRRQHRRHGVVDPDLDRPELFFDAGGCRFDRPGVGNIDRDGARPHPGRLDLLTSCL